MLYLDTSALVKLVVAEAESTALRRWLKSHPVRCVTSELSRIELVRAVRAARASDTVLKSATSLFDGIAVVPMGAQIVQRAGLVDLVSLCTLDAIHVASALLLGAGTIVITYDDRLASAARVNGFEVASPMTAS